MNLIFKTGAMVFGVVFMLVTVHVTMVTSETPDATDGPSTSIERRLNDIVLAHDIPSLSVAIVRPDGEPLQFHFGQLMRGSNTPVSGTSVYQIASLSKLLTGIVITSLVQNGSLDYDAPFVSYLADDLDSATYDRLSGVTLIQLLQHQSGIVDTDCSLYRHRREGHAWQHGYLEAELLDDLTRIQIPDGPPTYSSCAYAIAGLVAARASGLTYDAMLNQYVVAPFGLESTGSTAGQTHLVTPYDKRDRDQQTQPSRLGLGTPASGVFSTLDDLTKILIAQISAYQTDGDPSGPLILTHMLGGGPRDEMRYGIGLFQIDHPIGPLLGLDGDADGYASLYLFDPEKGVGIILLTGSGGDWVINTGLGLLAELLALSEED